MADNMTSFVAQNSSVLVAPVITLLMSALLATVLMATLILSLIRWKGQICPGQQRRLIKQSHILTLLWLIFSLLSAVLIDGDALLTWLSASVAGMHALSLWDIKRLPFSISKSTLLTRYCSILSSVLGITTAVVFISAVPDTRSLLITTLLTLGAVFAHLLMVAARCRLQAFHRLLPLVGFIGIFSACGNAVYQAFHIPVGAVLSASLMIAITARLILLVGGFLLWVWPLIMYRQYAYMADAKMKAKAVPSLQRLIWVCVLYLCSTLLAVLI